MSRRTSNRTFAVIALVVSLLLAGVVSFYASSSPDGLEHVAAQQGFEESATEHRAGDGPLADYQVKGVDNERLSGGLAGVIGVVVVGVLMGGLVLVLRRRDGSARTTAGSTTGASSAGVSPTEASAAEASAADGERAPGAVDAPSRADTRA